MATIDTADLKVIAFDADDTLWVNEPLFRQQEEKFTQLLSRYDTPHAITTKLYEIEVANIKHYGYGIKGFMLSLMETALELSGHQLSGETMARIIQLGHEMLNHPVELLPGVQQTLKQLQGLPYRLIVVTKGDLFDQENKLEQSGLLGYFHHTEVLSEKKEANYVRLLKKLDLHAHELLMVGNSLKSDVLPAINIGAQAVHIPFHTTWAFEEAEPSEGHNYITLKTIEELPALLKG